jgi:hypothetical protein
VAILEIMLMANYTWQQLRNSINFLKAVSPKTFAQQQAYRERRPENHTIKPKTNEYGTSGELDSRPNAENDFS